MSDQFHAHLDECAKCRNQPFALCATGAMLLSGVDPPVTPSDDDGALALMAIAVALVALRRGGERTMTSEKRYGAIPDRHPAGDDGFEGWTLDEIANNTHHGQPQHARDLARDLIAAQAEVAAWRTAYTGVAGSAFGPQSPEEVTVFLEQRDRVDRECQEYVNEKLVAAQAELHQWRNGPQLGAMQEELNSMQGRAVDAERALGVSQARIAELEAERDAAFDRGRGVGREDVGKYSNVIGRIESALGYAGGRPLFETAEEVASMASKLAAAEATIERVREAIRQTRVAGWYLVNEACNKIEAALAPKEGE